MIWHDYILVSIVVVLVCIFCARGLAAITGPFVKLSKALDTNHRAVTN